MGKIADSAPRGATAELLEQFPDAEVQTDKPTGKILMCVECKEKPLLTNAFYAPANAKCSACKGVSGNGRGSVAVPQVGRTDPENAAHLEDCLINRAQFEEMTCPFGCGEMELKSVNHNDFYGPSKLIGYRDGKPVYNQIAKGETVMHQCNECRCTVSMSTTAQTVFRRLNEPRLGKHVNGWKETLGTREEGAK